MAQPPSIGRNLRLGIFVAMAVAVLCGSILVLGGDKLLFQKSATFYVEFPHAQGLAVGSVVSMAGLEIGNVTNLKIAENRDVIVAELTIAEKYLGRITNESDLEVRTQGALGDKYIYVAPAMGGEPIVEGSTLVSKAKPDLLDILSAKSSEVGGSAVDLIKELHSLLKEMNANQRMSRLMENMAAVTKNLDRVTGDPELRQSLIHLNSILTKIDKGDGTLGALINDSSLHDKLMGFLGESPRNNYLKPLIRDSIKSSERARK